MTYCIVIREKKNDLVILQFWSNTGYFLHRPINSNPILFNMSRHLSVQAVNTVYLDQDGC